MSGIYRIVTRKPELDELSGSFRGGLATTDGGGLSDQVEGMVNVPLVKDKAAVRVAAERLGVDPRQVVLAWMLQHSSAMLPIPGTGSPKHLEANVAAASLSLTGQEQSAIASGG